MPTQEIKYLIIDREHAGQRLDNFLLCQLKGIPKSHVYKLLRKGEVRVNKKRKKPDYRIQTLDEIRIPPVRQSDETPHLPPSPEVLAMLNKRILYEDKELLIINKPAGFSVHGGSRVSMGLIELLRYNFPHCKALELVHRLDRETSGCLILAKKRSILKELHTMLREGELEKRYASLVMGSWPATKREVTAALLKNQLRSGERVVTVHEEGKPSHTLFVPLENFASSTLVEASPQSGRTHQIRVHATYAGHPIAGDEKYGDKAFNRLMREYGLKRLFLHATSVSFTLKSTGQKIFVKAELEPELKKVLEKLR